MSKTQNNTHENKASGDSTDYEAGDELYNDDVEALEKVFSAKVNWSGSHVSTLFQKDSGQYIHTRHNSETISDIDGTLTSVYKVVQTGFEIETTLQPEDLDGGAEIGFILDDWPIYDSRWSGRTISVSTIMDGYSDGYSDDEVKRIKDAGEMEVTFEIKLVSTSDAQ